MNSKSHSADHPGSAPRFPWWGRPALRRSLGVLLATGRLAGCAHSRSREIRSGSQTPKIPPFLSGPVAALLVDSPGFQGKVTWVEQVGPSRVETVTGELAGRGSWLLYVPAADSKAAQREGGISFLWNVAENRGWLLDEALQGCAPMAATHRYTTSPPENRSAGPVERLQGHPCGQELVAVHSNDGEQSAFRVWRAQDMQGFPLCIAATNRVASPKLTFSKLRLGAVPAEAFQPPDGFRKYESVEALLNEQTLRQRNLRKGPQREVRPSDLDDLNPDRLHERRY